MPDAGQGAGRPRPQGTPPPRGRHIQSPVPRDHHERQIELSLKLTGSEFAPPQVTEDGDAAATDRTSAAQRVDRGYGGSIGSDDHRRPAGLTQHGSDDRRDPAGHMEHHVTSGPQGCEGS